MLKLAFLLFLFNNIKTCSWLWDKNKKRPDVTHDSTSTNKNHTQILDSDDVSKSERDDLTERIDTSEIPLQLNSNSSTHTRSPNQILPLNESNLPNENNLYNNDASSKDIPFYYNKPPAIIPTGQNKNFDTDEQYTTHKVNSHNNPFSMQDYNFQQNHIPSRYNLHDTFNIDQDDYNVHHFENYSDEENYHLNKKVPKDQIVPTNNSILNSILSSLIQMVPILPSENPFRNRRCVLYDMVTNRFKSKKK